MQITSITPITQVIWTNGSQPVLAHCSDEWDYVCKYDSPSKLFNEYVAASFLKMWEIPTPEFSLIQIKQSHIPDEIVSGRIQPAFFNKPCFGSRHLAHAQDITAIANLLLQNDHERRKIHNTKDFLKIALFDLWVANTDRNTNNHNLLLNPEPHGNVIYAIDHSDIFDGCRLGHNFGPLTYHDSILSADFARILLPNRPKLINELDQLTNEFYLCASLCEQNVENIIGRIPKEWKLPIVDPTLALKQALFDNNHWKDECLTLLRQYTSEATR